MERNDLCHVAHMSTVVVADSPSGLDTCQISMTYLNRVIVEFDEDERRQGRVVLRVLQALANAVDSVKPTT